MPAVGAGKGRGVATGAGKAGGGAEGGAVVVFPATGVWPAGGGAISVATGAGAAGTAIPGMVGGAAAGMAAGTTAGVVTEGTGGTATGAGEGAGTTGTVDAAEGIGGGGAAVRPAATGGGAAEEAAGGGAGGVVCGRREGAGVGLSSDATTSDARPGAFGAGPPGAGGRGGSGSDAAVGKGAAAGAGGTGITRDEAGGGNGVAADAVDTVAEGAVAEGWSVAASVSTGTDADGRVGAGAGIAEGGMMGAGCAMPDGAKEEAGAEAEGSCNCTILMASCMPGAACCSNCCIMGGSAGLEGNAGFAVAFRRMALMRALMLPPDAGDGGAGWLALPDCCSSASTGGFNGGVEGWRVNAFWAMLSSGGSCWLWDSIYLASGLPSTVRIFPNVSFCAFSRRNISSMPRLKTISVCKARSPFSVRKTNWPCGLRFRMTPRSSVPVGRAAMACGMLVALVADPYALTPSICRGGVEGGGTTPCAMRKPSSGSELTVPRVVASA